MLRDAACWIQKLITSIAALVVCQRAIDTWNHEKGGLHSVDIRKKYGTRAASICYLSQVCQQEARPAQEDEAGLDGSAGEVAQVCKKRLTACNKGNYSGEGISVRSATVYREREGCLNLELWVETFSW